MFAVDCPERGQQLLVLPSQLRGIVNHEEGIDVAFRCPCGGRGVWRTGSRAVGERLLRHDGPPGADPPPAHGVAHARSVQAGIMVTPHPEKE